MFSLPPGSGPPRVVARIPGVPDDLARALDRRLRLDRQHQRFRVADRSQEIPASSTLNGRAEPGPA
jgi:hypothetical protein